jgi:predicted dehydrogenase
LVTTPNACHLADVLLAFRCGKPVLREAYGVHAGECRTMVAPAAPNYCWGAQVFRFERARRMRDRLAVGQIGKAIFARSEFYFRKRGIRGLDPRSRRGWRRPIADVGVHCVDALRYILQDEVVRVSARGQHELGPGAVESAAVLTLEFSRGTLGTVAVSFCAEYRTPLELVVDTGVLRADDALNVERPITLELRRAGSLVETDQISNRMAYARQADAFAAAVEGKTSFPVPGEEGWQNQEILDAAYRSMQSGNTEEVARVR